MGGQFIYIHQNAHHVILEMYIIYSKKNDTLIEKQLKLNIALQI